MERETAVEREAWSVERPTFAPRSTLYAPREIWRYHEFQGPTNNCAPFCVAMAANVLLGERRYLAEELARELNRPVWRWWPPPPLLYRRVPRWATFPWGPADALRRMRDHQGRPCFRARWRLFGDEERLRRNLREGRITLVSVGGLRHRQSGRFQPWGHVKILYAWDPGLGWAFVDPAINPTMAHDEWGRSGIGWQDPASFARQWRNMLRWTTEVELWTSN